MFYSADVRHERFWRVGIARNVEFFHSFVASKVSKGRSEKRGGAKDRLFKMSPKFAPRLRARAIWTSKSLKIGLPGALFEVELDKICTTHARESDLDVKIVKNWHAGSTDFWKLKSPKFAPCLRARAIWKSKSLKIGGVGALLEVSFAKIAPRLRARAIRKSKSLKRGMLGALLEV